MTGLVAAEVVELAGTVIAGALAGVTAGVIVETGFEAGAVTGAAARLAAAGRTESCWGFAGVACTAVPAAGIALAAGADGVGSLPHGDLSGSIGGAAG